jgi:hypothetical protein
MFVEDREVDPAEVMPETSAPHDVGDAEHLPVLHARPAAFNAGDPFDAFDPRRGDVIRPDAKQWSASAPALETILRPTGVFLVMRLLASHQKGREKTAGETSPVLLPDNHVWWSLAASSATSAPEFPAPTTSTSPCFRWDGLRY